MKHSLNIGYQLILALTLASSAAYSHEGHDHSMPGVLPAGSHGGKIVEAESKSGETGSKDELFFEVVHKGKQVSIWPKVLKQPKLKEFEEISPNSLANIDLQGENGRTKEKKPLTKTVSEKSIEAEFDLKGSNFGFVHISVDHAGVRKTARAQVSKH